MESLPNELLQHILQQIPFEEKNWVNVLLTCKDFCTIGQGLYERKLQKIHSIFTLGGTDSEDCLNSVERYDVRTNTWNPISPMQFLRQGHSVVTHKENIYVIGGREDHFFDTVERYDTIRNQWSRLTSLKFPRSYLTSVRYRDSIFAIGGFDGYNPLASVEENKILSDSTLGTEWVTKTPLKTPRSGLGAAVVGDFIYAAGGTYESTPLKTTESYNIELDCWKDSPSMNESRSGLAVTACDHNTLYAIGGWSEESQLKTVERLDSRTGKWVSVAPMRNSKSAHRAVTVGPYIYVMGGYDGKQALSSVERFDCRANTWEVLAELPSRKYSMGVALVVNEPDYESSQ